MVLQPAASSSGAPRGQGSRRGPCASGGRAHPHSRVHSCGAREGGGSAKTHAAWAGRALSTPTGTGFYHPRDTETALFKALRYVLLKLKRKCLNPNTAPGWGVAGARVSGLLLSSPLPPPSQAIPPKLG